MLKTHNYNIILSLHNFVFISIMIERLVNNRTNSASVTMMMQPVPFGWWCHSYTPPVKPHHALLTKTLPFAQA